MMTSVLISPTRRAGLVCSLSILVLIVLSQPGCVAQQMFSEELSERLQDLQSVRIAHPKVQI